MKKDLLVFLPSRQFNEEEYLVPSTALKRSGYSLFVASDTSGLCEGINGLKVKPDMNILNIHENNFAAVILIGGSGARNYWNNKILLSVVKNFYQKTKIVAAICSAPVILAKSGILYGIAATCFFEDRMELINSGADYKETPVVVRKNIITANGSNASKEFAEAIISNLDSDRF